MLGLWWGGDARVIVFYALQGHWDNGGWRVLDDDILDSGRSYCKVKFLG